MEIILPSFAERLKPLRKSKKMTQRAMSELLDCTERHYQKIEYGQINVPATTVIFLADYLGVTADYRLGGVSGRPWAPLNIRSAFMSAGGQRPPLQKEGAYGTLRIFDHDNGGQVPVHHAGIHAPHH